VTVTSVNDRSHLSIGEVLSLLQEDFPDVSISKIRFLESQGLLDPERTPSGYRKFYDADILRLRWILRQQRENFLPLKVIKDRLIQGDVDFGELDTPEEPEEVPEPEPEPQRPPRLVAAPNPADPPTVAPASLLQEAPSLRGSDAVRRGPNAEATPRRAGAEHHGSLSEGAPRRRLLDGEDSDVTMTMEELCRATGLSAREVTDLERFGMITGRPLGAVTYYDEEALTVARLAAGFRSHGVEARHLRMYKMAAQREVGLFEQLLLPLLRKRAGGARREAAELADELASLGDSLRATMLRQQLRDYLDRA
jgi:DNA-binding transcriptional MerR regulator